MALIRFLFLMSIYTLGRIFYRFDVSYIGNTTPDDFRNMRVGMILNHTSLFEALFSSSTPIHYMWLLANHGAMPVADVTMNRPIVGCLIRMLVPQVITITRKRDHTWNYFLESLDPKSCILLMPEGRMKRPNGLDKDGKPMTVRGGIVDILKLIKTGRMMIGYSGGLHHVQAPGEGFPRLFQRISISYESMRIEDYLASFAHFSDPRQARIEICKDLERRRDLYASPS